MGKNNNAHAETIGKDLLFFVFFSAIFISVFCITLAFRQNPLMTNLFKTMFYIGIVFVAMFLIYPVINKRFISELRFLNYFILMSMLTVVLISLYLFAYYQ